MSEHSGKFARLGAASTSAGFTLTETNDSRKYSASNLQCGTGRKKGKFDWNGTAKGYGGLPPFMPGQTFPFEGYTAPSNDVSGPGDTAIGEAIVTQVVITWNFEDVEIIDWQITFAGNGPLTWDNGSVVTDTTDPTIPSTCGLQIQNGTDSFDHVTEVVLTITSDVKEFTNTSTHANGMCWVGRRAGVIDFTLAISQQCTDRAQDNSLKSAPAIGTDHEIKLYVDSSTFWNLKWVHITGYSGLSADNETADIIARTINGEMNGYVEGQGIGEITVPGGTVFWPAPAA